MTLTFWSILIAILGLATFVVLHVLISRFGMPEKRWQAMRNLYLAMLVTLWLVSGSIFESLDPEHLKNSNSWIDYAAIVLLLFLIHIGYLTVYGFVDRSITLRTFIEIEKRNGQSISFAELEKIYNPMAAYLRRLEILCEAGYLRFENDQQTYSLTAKGVWVAKIIQTFKALYRMGPGG